MQWTVLVSRASFLRKSAVLPFPVSVCYSPCSRWICMSHCVPLLAPGTISARKGVNPLHYYLDPDSRPWASSLAFHNVQKRIPQGSTNCKMLVCLVIPMGPGCASGGWVTTCNLFKTCKRSSFSLAYCIVMRLLPKQWQCMKETYKHIALASSLLKSGGG